MHDLHKKLLVSLSKYLNELHQVNYSIRFWQTLLDPWLLTYISVAYDRWENLRIFFESSSERYYKIVLNYSDDYNVHFDYSDFLNSALSDEWNEYYISKLIIDLYPDRCEFIKNESTTRINKSLPISLPVRPKFNFTFTGIQYLILRFLRKTADVVFVETNIGGGLVSKLKIQWALKKIVFFYVNEITDFDYSDVNTKLGPYGIRERLNTFENFIPNTQFEEYISKNIMNDLPISLVESFSLLYEYASNIKIVPKVVITAGAAWVNTIAKFWFAILQEKGVKVNVSEHGGSFPAFRELFDFEEDISDNKITWFLPMHYKQIKLPPLKLVGLYDINQKNKKDYCAIIGNECSKYVYRVQYYPLSSQCLYSFSDICLFYSHLTQQIKEKVIIRPYANVGWNTFLRFRKILNNKTAVTRDGDLENFILRSKLVICTYPETTFAEAMATGIPTVLFFNEKYNERNDVTSNLIEEMKQAHIIFSEPLKAADHINNIWDDPLIWWNSDSVKLARAHFKEQALYHKKDWDKVWANFLSNEMNDTGSKRRGNNEI